jgi:hypothetical protein
MMVPGLARVRESACAYANASGKSPEKPAPPWAWIARSITLTAICGAAICARRRPRGTSVRGGGGGCIRSGERREREDSAAADLDHSDVAARRLVALRVHHPRGLEAQQPRLSQPTVRRSRVPRGTRAALARQLAHTKMIRTT